MTTPCRRLGSWLGVVGIALSLGGIGVALALAPWFSITANALSDLGVAGRASALPFNGGLIAGGVLGLGFVARLRPETSGSVEKLGVSLFGLAFGCLSLVGVFPSPHPYHAPVAVAFFLCFTVALVVHGSGEALVGHVREGLVTIWLGIAHVTGWVVWVLAGVEGVAIPEAFGALVLGIWVAWRTWRLRELP